MPTPPSSALVTGANGFVGSHLVEALVGRGTRVRCLVRRTSDLRWIPQDKVDLVYGEITDPGSLAPAVTDADIVYHLAGLTMAGSADAYMRVNAGGTRALAEAARAAGVDRFLLVSSLAAAGPSSFDRARSEDDEEAPTSNYGKSKLAGEAAVRETEGLSWTIVRPPAVYGPRDVDFLKLFRLVKRGSVPQPYGRPQQVSMVEVHDLVRSIIVAGETPAARGRVYFATHAEPDTWPKIGAMAAAAMGCPYRTVSLPRWMLPAISRLSAVSSWVRRQPNPYPIDRVRDLLQPAWTCSGTRAERELGFRAETPHAEGISRTVSWYRDMGWLS